MLQQIKNVWDIMGAVQLFPSIIILGLGLYFVAKDKMGIDPKKAPLVPLVINVIAQFGFAWPTGAQDIVMNLSMGLANACISIGIYSAADKYGLMDKLGKRAGKAIDGADATPEDTK